jgi:hypothetical protein
MPTNPDFRDLFAALNDAEARYLVVGGHALAFHAVPRFTKDLDVWVEPTVDNAVRVMSALVAFGAPLVDLSIDDLASPGNVYQMGVPPNRIDLLTEVEGTTFEQAWSHRKGGVYGGVAVSVIGLDELIVNKRAVGRPQDLVDADLLESVRAREATGEG